MNIEESLIKMRSFDNNVGDQEKEDQEIRKETHMQYYNIFVKNKYGKKILEDLTNSLLDYNNGERLNLTDIQRAYKDGTEDFIRMIIAMINTHKIEENIHD